MAGEWEETVLADVSSDVSYGYTESATDEKVGPRFLRITDIQNGVVNWANVPYCPISADNHQKYRLQNGDIVVARTGNSTGENFLYRGGEDAVFASYLIRFRIDRQKADPGFVWYNLRSRDWWNFINNSKTGSAQAGANAKILGLFPLNLPPLAEQRAIAHILGTLDDKIELNRRMNETLEAMARALFKSWFVDFDPVRAKAEGRLPAGRQATPPVARLGIWFVYALECDDGSFYIGHTEDMMRRFDEHASGKGAEWTKRHPPHRIAYWEELPTRDAAIAREKKLKTGSGREWLKAEILKRDVIQNGLPNSLADLFPDSFEDSELGEIPKGWEVQGIDEIANFLNGLALQKYPPGDGATLPVIKIAQLRKGDTEGADRCNTSVPPEYVINDGDVLFSWSGSLECVLWAGDRGALNQHLFKVTSTQFPKWFCYLWVHEHLASFRHTATGKATTMGHIQRHHLSDAKVVVPGPNVLSAADKMIAPIIEQVMQRRVESRTLATLRDALLPKLITGELRVNRFEAAMKTAP